MSRLNDIKGYYDMSSSYDFNDHNMWEGKILLEDDGWFEGIVVDPNSSYTQDRFVFGVYHPTKVIELFKFVPVNVSAPFVFHGRRDAKGYDGELEVIELSGSIQCGVSHIITQDAELARGDVTAEVDELKARIQNYKDNTMDDIGREFYDNSIAMRHSMCRIILRNYEGKGFTEAEIAEIMEECGPVNERVMQATTEAKRRAKIKPKDIITKIEDEDDLPF